MNPPLGRCHHRFGPDRGYNHGDLVHGTPDHPGFLNTPMPPQLIRRVSPVDFSEWLRMRCLLWPKAGAEDLQGELDSVAADPLTPVFVAERPEGGLCGFLEAGTRSYAD